eukprot:Skav203926  [mRNA]  locus=scaffold228:445320:445820:+ [translate_table: standard]
MHTLKQGGPMDAIFTCFSVPTGSKLTLDQVDILFRSHGDLCVDVMSWLACHVKVCNVFEASIHLHQEPHGHHVPRVLPGEFHLECSHLISIGVGERQQLRLIHCAPRSTAILLGAPNAVIGGELQDTLLFTTRAVHQHQAFGVGSVACIVSIELEIHRKFLLEALR